MKLFFVRHGETTANLNHIYAGQSDVKLTDVGRKQAEAIRPILEPFHFDKVYSSDLSRAIDTQTLALPGVTGEQTPLIREFDVGSLVGQSYATASTMNLLNPEGERDYSLIGGESSAMVCDRVKKFLEMLENDPCEYVAAFAHNGTMLSMLQLVIGSNYNRAAFPSSNCAIHVFEYTGTIWRLLAWNYMGEIK